MSRPDYTKIADNDPSGDLETALATMLLMTEESVPEEVMITYRTVGRDVGLAESKVFEDALVDSDAIPSWVNTALNDGGINVNDPQVAGTLLTLLGAELANSIIALGVTTNLMFPSLRDGELQTSRDKRIREEA